MTNARTSPPLPIDAIRGDVDAALARPDVPIVVVAPTGSGKSTRVPIWAAERVDRPVLVIEPRRAACRSLATFLAEDGGGRVGGRIGYRVRFEDVTSRETRVVFVTPGVALRMLRGGRPLGFGAIVVDELHERGWEVDLAVAALRKRRALGELCPLLVMSATIDAEPLADRMGARVLRAGGRQFPVDVSYAGDADIPTRDHLEERVADAIRTALRTGDDGELLVFLPGKGEIEGCRDALRGIAASAGLELVPVHGALPTEHLARAFRARSGKRRVFLSTNVAETSVTLPDVTTVIDSGLVRMRVHRAGRSALSLCATSQSSMDQRAGRAGRVRPGRCLRLWGERYRPDPSPRPEIERIELDDLVLQARACGLSARDLEEGACFLTPPPGHALERATASLRRLGALDDALDLAPMGRRLSDLPVSAEDGRLLTELPADVAGTVADLVALLETGPRLLLDAPPGRDELTDAREELLRGCTDEVMANLRCLRQGDPARHGLHASALNEARRVARQLRALLSIQPPDPTRDEAPLPHRDRLAAVLLERMPEAAFVVRDRARGRARPPRGGEPWASSHEEVLVHPFQPPGNRERSVEAAPVAGLILETVWLGDERRYGVRGRGRMLLPCRRELLREAGLGEAVVREPQIVRERGGLRIIATVETVYAGVTLGTEDQDLRGTALCRAAAHLIMEGRLLRGARDLGRGARDLGDRGARDLGDRGARDLVRDAVHLHDLLVDWPEPLGGAGPRPPKVGDVEPALAARLEALGLTTPEDLELLEPTDLCPDLAPFGLLPYELDAFRTDFPRIVEHFGARYTTIVEPARRRVTLEPDNKEAARAKDPDALHVPRFRNFEVYYRRASRVVRVR